MKIEQFKELMKQGNRAISGVIINLLNATNLFATIEFDDIACDTDSVNFSYIDRRHDMTSWQGERSPFYGLQFEDIISVEQLPVVDNLFGTYCIKIIVPYCTIDMHFDVEKGFDIKPYGMFSTDDLKRAIETKSSDCKKEIEEVTKNNINTILSHNGTFLINVNGGDFIKSRGFEAFNLIFTNIKTLRQNELLSFDNSTMSPIRLLENNTPVYSMDFSTTFYVDTKNVESVEQIDADEFADVFEYNTKQIFNFHMEDETIITIGLYE